MLRTAIAVLLVSLSIGVGRAETQTPIRFGLTAVIVQEHLRFLDRWALYLSNKMDRPVKFVRRKSYREVMDLLEAGRLDFAWICGFPFVQPRDPEFLELLAVPVYKGKPLYNSYIIVPKDSPYRTLDDLKGKVFAFSDPESNSGFLYPQFLLATRGTKPQNFFRQTFFTYNHAETVEAVADQVADGGAVDSYIWEYLQILRPEIAARTRVIKISPAFGFPPLVSSKRTEAKAVERMKSVLLGMSEEPEGRQFLAGFKLDAFGDFPPELFDGIGQMANDTRKALLWLASAEKRVPSETSRK
ncbi:ABC transporter, phosphonate, periplasmic substrate-binding protein [bacterium BMS3Bbin10]|nr:ABC transporter, phosphonate, periplasmic substrate-binding protein [bacterium BMS3Bbin10]